MAFYPFHVSVAIITYVVLGGFTVFFGMFSLLIREKLYLGEAILAFLFGVIIGPYGANIFNPRDWGNGSDEVVQAITLEITRVVLAIGVFAIGVELPSKYMQKHYKSLLFLMGPVMAVGWVICAGLIYALIPAIDFLSSLAIAACLTPTDPILAAAVINGRYAEKHVPEHLRHLLSAESGANDGAAFPFLFLALYLILEKDDRVAIGEWFYITWVYEIILGIIIGTLIGYGFRHLMKFCETKQLIDRHSYVAQYISLALLSNGVTALLGSDDLLAAFFSGTAFAWDSHFNKQTADSVFSTVTDLLFNVAIFVFIGAWMPFSSFNSPELTLSVWRLVVIGILVLLLRRLPVILFLYKWIPDIRTFREAVFSGHFGPMGVGAIFIATLAREKLPHPHDPPQNRTDVLSLTIEPIIAFMVMCSILIHGLSIPFFNLGRRVTSLSIPRTLSLRGSHEPEWAANTRKVSRPEDIVINRDPLPAPTITTVNEKELEEGRAASSPVSSTHKPTEGGSPAYEVEVREWREGRHLVREYHPKEPGREVRVEVIRDAYEPSGSPNLNSVKATFTLAENAIKEEVMRYLGSFSARNSLERTRSRRTVSSGAPLYRKDTLEDSPVLVDDPNRPEIVEEEVARARDDNDSWVDEPDSGSSTGAEGARHSLPRATATGSKTTHTRPKKRRESVRRSALGAGRTHKHHHSTSLGSQIDSFEMAAANSPNANSRPHSSPTSPTSPSSPGFPRSPSITHTPGSPTPHSPNPIIRVSGAAFERTDSISSVRSLERHGDRGGDRVGRLRYTEGTSGMPSRIQSREASPSRVKFANEPSRPPSRHGNRMPRSETIETDPDSHTQKTSALGPIRR